MTSHPSQLPTELTENLRKLIHQARVQAVRQVNSTQVQTYWHVGRHIVEFEQAGENRATYGKKLLANLAEQLSNEFGKGFDASNLRAMRLFYNAFPNCGALRHELSWTHYRMLTRLDNADARAWYMDEAASQNWSTRVLERQMASLSYERLLSSQDQLSTTQNESSRNQHITNRDFVRDPVMLEFLGLPDTGRFLYLFRKVICVES